MNPDSRRLTPVVITEAPSPTLNVQIQALPQVVTTGLDHFQINAINDAVISINHGLGRLLKETAATLVQLKGKVPTENWLKFLDSKSIPLKSWHCQNLVRANDWLQGSVITDEQLTTIGYGVIAKISASLPALQKNMKTHPKHAKGINLIPNTFNPLPNSLQASMNRSDTSIKVDKGLQQRDRVLTKENKRLKAIVNQLKAENQELKTSLNTLYKQA